MNFKTLSSNFIYGIGWNAFFYFIYKIINTTLTFILFNTLSTHDFAIWANANSLIYLTLLWIDCGFRKSIPRYCPIFAQNTKTLKHFTNQLILFQTILLLITTPLLYVAIPYLGRLLFLSIPSSFVYCIAGLFFVEGMINIIRLIYHAQFLQKQFNLLHSIVLVIQACLNGLVFIMIKPGTQLIMALLSLNIVTGIVIIITAITMMKRYAKHTIEEHEVAYGSTMKGFIKHSSIMWGLTSIKSLSERNFLVPILTYIAGPGAANIFKVANDGALFFQRIIIKSIGTTDTSLLTHVQTSDERKKLMPIAIKKLFAWFTGLLLPLLGIFIISLPHIYRKLGDQYVFQLFFTITIMYFIEIILLPFERILEVKQRYIDLIKSYLPYTIIVVVLFFFPIYPIIGLYKFILILFGVRLVSLAYMAYHVCKYYGVSLRSKETFIVLQRMLQYIKKVFIPS